MGEFTAGSPEQTFLDEFKADFLLNVMPSEYRDRLVSFSTEEEALSESYQTDGTDLASEN